MDENIEFHARLEREIQDMGWGQLNVTVVLKEGVPVISTMNILRQRRRKYKIEGKDKIK